MTEKKVTVVNRAGIHARPASILVQTTKNFQCNIFFEKGSDKINAKSIMGIITLGAAYGTEIKIITDGEDEQTAIDTLAHLFETKFEEE
ncbi:MAG: HPr family phosphocarrier protein [Treponema sp.]|jgi:phosphocarrier protein|nr:HPr family phosphocarrier protein [Treponema sp.]